MSEPIRIEEPLFRRAELAGGATALVDGRDTYDYRGVAGAAEACARTLTAAGLGPGDRVATYLDTRPEAVVALYGTWRAGGVAVPVHRQLRTRQLDHILRDSGSRLLVSRAQLLAGIDAAILAGVTVLEIDAHAGGAPAAPTPSAGGPAAILYTSGSTGLPKGVLLSHDNLVAGSRIVAGYLGLDASDRILAVLPFSFDYGLNQLLTSVRVGGALVLQRSVFAPDICRSLEDHAVTGLAAVPPLWIQLMLDHSPFPRRAFPTLRYITSSGGVFPPALVARYRQVIPDAKIFLMYGLSEAFRSTYLPPDEIDRRPHSIGKAIPETEIHVVDEHGRACTPGEIGELVHRGPTVALGYWNDPDATAQVFRPSPFAGARDDERVVFSGDLVRTDADGYLTFVGRRDQLLKCYGHRVSPEEVEDAVLGSGQVSEVAACGEPDPVGGHAVVVHVVPRSPDAFSVERLLAWCRREMPRYLVPKSVVVHTALPRTTSGKIDRKALAG